jgi:uncharacterized protein (TIGR00730 family)
MVTVFGSAKPVSGDSAYTEAMSLGEQLARLQLGVVTGGYMGTMEAVSKGSAEAGGYVVGVTCEEIENWRPTSHNAWVHEVIHCTSLAERIRRLIQEGTVGLIALPGGIGTLAEIVLYWNHVIIHPEDRRPLIFIGQAWKATIQAFCKAQEIYLDGSLPANFHFVISVDEAVQYFKQAG